MTVLELIQRSTDFLAKKEVDSPRLQAELLLAHVLQTPRMQLYLNFEKTLEEMQLNAFRDLIKRRGQREPLQYLVGSTSFCGFEIKVNRHVLIPRPETELLAEQGWTFLRDLVSGAPERKPSAVDLGTGSGCLAVSLAANCPQAEVTAADISKEALEIAGVNAGALGVADRIQFVDGDFLQAVRPARRFDLIISNPPYIPAADIANLQAEVRDFEPRAALDGGPDGLAFYRVLAAQGASMLLPKGKLMFEFGDGQANALKEMFSVQNWVVERVLEDYTRRPRILIASIHGQSTH